MHVIDATIVGAGPAGVGMAVAANAIDGLEVSLIDAGQIGQTFHDWHPEQRFLTPSFTGNGFGATDLNSVHPSTSPAFTLGVDYPDGPGYARYLRSLVSHFRVPVAEDTRVQRITPTDDGFEIETDRGRGRSRTLVWAGGERSEPRLPGIRGEHLLTHSSHADAWAERSGRLAVIGGAESGIEIACHHVERGAEVSVIDAERPWGHGVDGDRQADPSFGLAPRIRIRMRAALETGRLELRDASATAVVRNGTGFRVSTSRGPAVLSETPPIAATGYGPGLGPAAELFDRRDDGWPLLTEHDESTVTPGLFLTGPALRHDDERFCFVYKYRQRFAHVARVIGERAGRDCSPLELWREQGMLLDDLSCCGTSCAC